jgi:hypothetical protein
LRRAKNRHTALPAIRRLPGPGAEETFCSLSDAEAAQTVKLGLSYLFDTGPIYYRYLIGFE